MAVLLLLSLWLTVGSLRAAGRRRWMGAGFRALLALGLFTTAVLLGLLVLATRGYRALTHEVTAATLSVEPTGPQRFTVRVQLPEGREDAFSLAGDEVYVDGHILKWKPLANVLGLHTAYELDRIGGRYIRLSDEVDGRRTIHALKEPRPFDLFTLRRKYALLAPLLDAEYGSATFVPADRAVRLEVRVSTSGLLIRRAET